MSTPRFVMPRPYSVVVWRHAVDQPACPAFVTSISRDAISVTIFPADMTRGVTKDGVRHVDDPEVAKISPDEGGFWDYTEDQKLLRTLVGEDAPAKTSFVK